MLVCPIVDEWRFLDMLDEASNKPASGNIGRCAVTHQMMEPVETLLAPLKKGEGGACIKIASPISLEEHHHSLIPLIQNGFIVPAFFPRLTQKAEPVLSRLKDLVIPAGLFDTQPIIDAKYEELSKWLTANSKWKLQLPRGWETLPLSTKNISCPDESLALTFGQYLNRDKNVGVLITICNTRKSAAEIAQTLYGSSSYLKYRHWPKRYSFSGKFASEPTEKHGSWILEASNERLKSICYITEYNGLYSLIQITGNNAASLEHGREFLKKLETDTPALFPKNY